MFFRSPFTLAQRLHDRPLVLLFDVQRHVFVRLLFTPSISRKITFGRETASSKPLRRIFSISTDRCSSPRPDTRNASASSVSSTRAAPRYAPALVQTVKNLDEKSQTYLSPQNGEVLTQKNIDTVGSSTDSAGSVSTFCGSQMVSEMFSRLRP